MKDSLIQLIQNSILLEYSLPNSKLRIQKTPITSNHLNDDCYKVSQNEDLSRIIYESILYYSYDEYQLEGGEHQLMFLNAFNRKFKYNDDADSLAKRRLGIYGESLLYVILNQFYHTKQLISRGYFYDLSKKNEVTGYDSFHLVENGQSVELWFGETKFYEDYTGAINSVFKNINKAISGEYLVNTNFATILQYKGNIINGLKIKNILEKWEKGIIKSLIDELKTNQIKLVYPVLLTYNIVNDNYDQSIKEAIDHITNNYSSTSFPDIGIEYSIFFVFIVLQLESFSKLQELRTRRK